MEDTGITQGGGITAAQRFTAAVETAFATSLSRIRARSMMTGLVISLVFSGIALLGFLLFSAQFNQYATCMNAAGSVTSLQSACQTQLYNSVGSEVGVLGGS